MHVARMGEMINKYSEIPERNWQLGRPRHSREENMKVDVPEIYRKDVDWIYLGQYSEEWQAVVNIVNKKLPSSIKCREFVLLAAELLTSQEGLCFMDLVT